jgi:hypothetical protein
VPSAKDIVLLSVTSGCLRSASCPDCSVSGLRGVSPTSVRGTSAVAKERECGFDVGPGKGQLGETGNGEMLREGRGDVLAPAPACPSSLLLSNWIDENGRPLTAQPPWQRHCRRPGKALRSRAARFGESSRKSALPAHVPRLPRGDGQGRRPRR